MHFSIPSFLFLAGTFIGVNGQVPANDLCANAVVISTAEPTTVAGTFENATPDEYILADPICSSAQVESGDPGVWYKIEGLPDGRDVKLECDEQCQVLTTNDGCAATSYECTPGMSVGVDGGITRFRWTTGLGGFSTYYVLVGNDSPAIVNFDFTLTLTDETAPSASPTLAPVPATASPTRAPVEGGTDAPSVITTDEPTVIDSGAVMASKTAGLFASIAVAAAFLV